MLLYRIAPGRVSYPLDALRAVNTASNLCLTINSTGGIDRLLQRRSSPILRNLVRCCRQNENDIPVKYDTVAEN